MISVIKKIFKYLLITILILLIAGGSTLFLLRNRNLGTGFLKRQAISAARAAGYEMSIENLVGNPVRGYRIEGLSVVRENAIRIRLGSLRVALSFDTLLQGKPIDPISLRNGFVEIMDLSKLPKKDEPEQKKGTPWFPYIPVEIRNLAVRYPEVISDVMLTSADIGISPEKMSASVDGSIGDRPIESRLVMEMSDKVMALTHFSTTFDKKGRLEAKGRIAPDFSIEGSVASLDLRTVASTLPEGKRPDINGTVNFFFSLAGTPENPLFKGDLQVQEPGFQDFGINHVKGNISYDGSLLLISDLEADMLGTKLNADLSLSEKGDIDLVFSAENLDLSKLESIGHQLPKTSGIIEELKGDVSGDLQNLLGKVYARSSSVSIMDQKITNTKLDLQFEGRTVNINSTLHWEGQPISNSGKILLGPVPSLDLSTSVSNFDIAHIQGFLPPETAEQLPRGKFNLRARTTGSLKDPSVQLNINSPSLELNRGEITNIKADLLYRKPDLKIRELSCLLPEGSLSGSGTIALDKSNRTDISVTTSTDDISETLRLVPTHPEGISGSAEAVISVKGNINNPDITGSFETRNLRFQSMFQAERVNGNFSFSNNRLLLEIDTSTALLDRLLANHLSAGIEWQPGKLDLKEGFAELLGGRFTSSGYILLSKKPELHLSGTFDDLALEKLPWKIPVDIRGETYGEFSLSGTTEKPVVAFQLKSPNLVTEGMTLDNIIINADLRDQTLRLRSLFAQIGKGQIQGNANIDLARDFKTDFKIDGTRLDIPYLLRNMEGNLKDNIQGSVDISAEGSFSSGIIKAEAEISSESIKMQGFEIKDIFCPVIVESPKVVIPELKASLYKGILKSRSDFRMDTLEWDNSSSLVSMDLGTMSDSMEDLPLTMSGKAEAKIKTHGRGGDLFSIFGTGDLTLNDGDIGGLPAIKAAASTAGRETIRFRRARSNFLIDGFGVTILAGSRMEAPLKDPLYQHLALDGLIEYDGGLDIEGDAVVNVQALNAFFGGLQTAFRATLSKGDLLDDIMGGLLGRVTKKDYREILFHIEGTRDSPQFSKLEVQGGDQYISDLINIDEFNENKMERDDKQIQLKINFPVGKGGENKSPSAGEQFKNQLIEGILKGINPAY
jgi:hypothetical protein